MNDAARPAPKKRGPKPKPAGERWIPVTMRFRPENMARLKELAQVYGTSMGEVINRCVEETWANTPAEVMRAVESLRKFRAAKPLADQRFPPMNKPLRDEVPKRLTSDAAAAYLGRSRSWLDKERASGRGPRYFKIGQRIFYKPDDLDAFSENSVIETADTRPI